MGLELRLAINAAVRVVGDRERDGGGGLGVSLNAGACILALRAGRIFMYVGRFDSLGSLDSRGVVPLGNVRGICIRVLRGGLCFLGAGLRGYAMGGGRLGGLNYLDRLRLRRGFGSLHAPGPHRLEGLVGLLAFPGLVRRTARVLGFAGFERREGLVPGGLDHNGGVDATALEDGQLDELLKCFEQGAGRFESEVVGGHAVARERFLDGGHEGLLAASQLS